MWHCCSLCFSRFRYHSDFIVWVVSFFTTFSRPLFRLSVPGFAPLGGNGVTCPLPFMYWVFQDVALLFFVSVCFVQVFFFLCVDHVSVCCVSCLCGFPCVFWATVWSLFFIAHLALSSISVATLSTSAYHSGVSSLM